MPVTITGLYVYPIKSCRGTALESAQLDQRGIRHDRRWMVVRPDGMFVTQREYPAMARITVGLDDQTLEIGADGQSSLHIPIGQDGLRSEVQVWNDRCIAIDQGGDAAGWFSDFLGAPLRLVRMAEDYTRQVDQRYAPRSTDQTGFSDGYPLLLASEESLADLNGRLSEHLPMDRFRPNLVVRHGDEGFAEDGWKQIRTGEITFDVVKPCARCPIPTTDQITGERGPEPMRTLLSYRPKNAKGFPYFGQNIIHQSEGWLKVGQKVQILG